MELLKATTEAWREKGRGIVLTEKMNESRDEEDGVKTEPMGSDVGFGVCRDEDWAGRVVVLILGGPSEANAVESAMDIVL